MNYLVSILVPIYKVEKQIEKNCISLFEQSYDNLEFIFIDDCSPDNSIEVLKGIIERYPNRKKQCKIIRHEQNRGLAAARNTAVAVASGVFVCHVDSDDWLEWNAIENLVKRQKDTNADIVSGNSLRHMKSKTEIIIEPCYSGKNEMIDTLLSFCNPYYSTIWRRLIRRSLYIDNNLMLKEGVNQGEDYQMLPRLVYFSNKIAKINEVIYHYNCLNQNSYMNRIDKDQKLWNEDIGSYKIIESFFSNKKLEWKIASSKKRFMIEQYYLSKAAQQHNKYLYDELKADLCCIDDTILKEMGWYNLLKHLIYSNYLICMLAMNFRGLFSK